MPRTVASEITARLLNWRKYNGTADHAGMLRPSNEDGQASKTEALEAGV